MNDVDPCRNLVEDSHQKRLSQTVQNILLLQDKDSVYVYAWLEVVLGPLPGFVQSVSFRHKSERGQTKIDAICVVQFTFSVISGMTQY